MKISTNPHYLIATVLGLGYSPVAPGTVGSLAGLAAVVLLHAYTPIYITAFLAFFAMGVISSTFVEKEYAVKDPQIIVIDEFCAMFLVFLFVPITFASVITGFILFRVFDIIKLPPTRKIEKLPFGWGIMLDDIFAAFLANLILQVLKIINFI